jgi:hypothetical protein
VEAIRVILVTGGTERGKFAKRIGMFAGGSESAPISARKWRFSGGRTTFRVVFATYETDVEVPTKVLPDP